MEVLREERKGSSPESIMFQRFYNDTWSMITEIKFVLVVSSTMAEVRLPQRDSRKGDVLLVVLVLVILDL